MRVWNIIYGCEKDVKGNKGGESAEGEVALDGEERLRLWLWERVEKRRMK